MPSEKVLSLGSLLVSFLRFVYAHLIPKKSLFWDCLDSVVLASFHKHQRWPVSPGLKGACPHYVNN
eukprot:1657714-Amphidinium_carterae.2